MKTCTKCKIEKPKTEFHNSKYYKDGLCYTCKSCVSAIKKQWNIDNPGRCNQATTAWNEKNPERRAATNKRWAQENPQKIAAAGRKYRSKNPEKIQLRDRSRRAKKKMAEGHHTAKDVSCIFESQAGLCASCETKLFKSGKNRFHVDHIMPLARGGSNDKYNLQCLCPSCNHKKSAKDPIDWAKENGRLL